MPHVFEPAASGRSKCRGCARPIARGEIRFGERLPNPFADGEMTLWFHPRCAAYKRPEPMLEALEEAPRDLPDRQGLEAIAQRGVAHRRLARIDGAQRAPGSQARCRHCRQPIERGSWRVRLVYFEEGQFAPSGFLHLGCRKEYFDTEDILDPAVHFSPDLSDDERAELERVLGR